MKIEDILKPLGIKYEELDSEGHSGERDALNSWLEALSKSKVTIESIREYITSMKAGVEKELTEYPEGKLIKIWFIKIRIGRDKDKELMLKARLRNYMLLEAFLSTPERAKQALEKAVEGMVTPKE